MTASVSKIQTWEAEKGRQGDVALTADLVPAPVFGRKSKAGDNADEMVVGRKNRLMRYIAKRSKRT